MISVANPDFLDRDEVRLLTLNTDLDLNPDLSVPCFPSPSMRASQI
jgi:hypothetical protein